MKVNVNAPKVKERKIVALVDGKGDVFLPSPHGFTEKAIRLNLHGAVQVMGSFATLSGLSGYTRLYEDSTITLSW